MAAPMALEEAGSVAEVALPLSATALWTRPFAEGIEITSHTFAPPPDWPMMVTLPGSPPKFAMLSWTHCRDATRSRTPTLPEFLKAGPAAERSEKPKALSRWFTETNTISPARARFAPW